jgi:alpha-amylase/alpha-mannosidase (GH57 family)
LTKYTASLRWPTWIKILLNLILCWHFHQPDYRDADGRYELPWTYLHVIKDYADMAAHLEAAPNLRCVVNFVPSLVEQIDDYAAQFASGEVRDPLLAQLIEPDLGLLDMAARHRLVTQCFKLNHLTMLEPFPAYRRLYTLWKTVEEGGEAGLAYLSGQYLADLVTWYHLAWTGETVRRARPDLLALMKQGEGFSLAQRRELFDLYGAYVSDLIPRYRHLAERGQIELSSTPHSHPILPLLLDFKAARDARPHLPLPTSPTYPEGEVRAVAHVRAAMDSHAAHFGKPPVGFWPAEGGVSQATLALFSQAGVKWAASGEGVLRHSLIKAGSSLEHKPTWISTPYRLNGYSTALFFRDDHLSDLIGFEYKGWHGDDAVRHLLHALEELRRHAPGPNPVVSIILDGENAWEYYPYNGYYFLTELFSALSAHASIRPTTFSDYLDLHPDAPRPLSDLAAGSWVYGDFTTWMGDPAKNRGWDWLCAAKQAFDAAVDMLPEDEAEAAEALLKSCESSDWFWWFGDYNPADAVDSFDRVYRQKLKRLYQTLRIPAPKYLDTPLCRGGGATESGGVMRRGGA